MSLERVALQELSDRVRELEMQINSVMKLLITLCGGDLLKT